MTRQLRTQREIMLEDIAKHPGTTGVYRGIKWKTRRPSGTYLCGYVLDQDNLTAEVVDKLDGIAHGGLTHEIGFDCAHYNDYAPFSIEYEDMCARGVYKTHDYVVSLLHEMIDAILDSDTN